MRASIVVLLFLGFLLAGCFGSGDVEPEREVVQEEGAGLIEGMVANGESLEPIAKVRIRLIQDNDVRHETNTTADGNYTIKNIEPGTYRLQAFHLRYNPAAESVTIKPDEVMHKSIMLERMVVPEEVVPYDQLLDWDGNWCGAVTVLEGAPFAPCQSLDENHDTSTRDEPDKGLRTVLLELVWDNQGPTSADEFTLSVVNILGESYEYARETGSSPLQIRIDDSDIEAPDDEDDDDWRFSAFDEEDGPTLTLSFRVEPTVGVIWQQAFKLHYRFYYWEEAPSGASALD